MTVENIELNPSIMGKFYLHDIRAGYWIWKKPQLHLIWENSPEKFKQSSFCIYLLKLINNS